MAQNLKQFNFKLPESLLKQLDKLAETKKVTKTELVIQGIRQVLGLTPDKSQASRLDVDVYQQIDKLEQRLQESIDYQSGVDLETNKRIKTLEEMVKDIQGSLSILDIVDHIVNVSTQKVPNPNQNIDIVDDVVPKLKQSGQLEEKSIDNRIVKNINPEDNTPQLLNPSEKTQLAILELDTNEDKLLEDAKKVNSLELVKILQQADPGGKWHNDRITAIRRSKKQQNSWHTVEDYNFKYAGENKGDPKHKHLWWLTRLNEEKS